MSTVNRAMDNPIRRGRLPKTRPQMAWPTQPKSWSAIAVLATLFGAGLLVIPWYIYSPHGAEGLGTLTLLPAMLAVPRLCRALKQHFLCVCTASPVDRHTAAQLRDHGMLPQGIPRVSRYQSLREALDCWINCDFVDLPGMLNPPIPDRVLRIALLAITTLLVAATTPLLAAVISDLFSDGSFVRTVAALFGLSCCPVPIILFAFCLSDLTRQLTSAAALRRHAGLCNFWSAFLSDMRGSSDRLERESIFLGRVLVDNSPVLLPLSDFESHMSAIGSTRSGKTAFFIHLIEQALRLGYSIIVLDLKADSFELLHTMMAVHSTLGGGRSPLASEHAAGGFFAYFQPHRPELVEEDRPRSTDRHPRTPWASPAHGTTASPGLPMRVHTASATHSTPTRTSSASPACWPRWNTRSTMRRQPLSAAT